LQVEVTVELKKEVLLVHKDIEAEVVGSTIELLLTLKRIDSEVKP